MTFELIEKHIGSRVGARLGARLGQAVFLLDRWLRRRSGVVEYCNRPDCVFRIEPCVMPCSVRLHDGTVVNAGAPAIRLHFWNERMPRMPQGKPSLRWARRMTRSVQGSLRELSYYLSCRAELASTRMLFADMHLASAWQGRQFCRIVTRLGFELAASPEPPRRSPLHRMGEVFLVLLLVLATNPVGLRRALRARQRRIYLSRATLDLRYGTVARRSRASGPGRGWSATI